MFYFLKSERFFQTMVIRAIKLNRQMNRKAELVEIQYFYYLI